MAQVPVVVIIAIVHSVQYRNRFTFKAGSNEPPCQGFSHAGFRLDDDSRNDLASVYINMAKMLNPRIFMLENVEGLIT